MLHAGITLNEKLEIARTDPTLAKDNSSLSPGMQSYNHNSPYTPCPLYVKQVALQFHAHFQIIFRM